MKTKSRIAIVLVVALCAFLIFRQKTVSSAASSAKSVEAKQTESKISNATSVVPRSLVADVGSTNPVKEKAPPEDSVLSVWNDLGQLTDEFVKRYELTSLQISQLNELKAECVRRMQAIDLAAASVAVSPDGQSISITIKSDPTAAKTFTEFYQNSLKQILGEGNYADLAKYYRGPTLDDSINAGLVDKQISVQKVAVNSLGTKYHIKAESKLLVTPPGMSPGYNTHEIETSGNRDHLSVAYSGIDNLLPNNF